MCPDCYSEEVEVGFEIKIVDFTPPVKLQRLICGKNPIWNLKYVTRGEMDENLEFASNIIMKFTNGRKKPGWFDDNIVGEVCV